MAFYHRQLMLYVGVSYDLFVYTQQGGYKAFYEVENKESYALHVR